MGGHLFLAFLIRYIYAIYFYTFSDIFGILCCKHFCSCYLTVLCPKKHFLQEKRRRLNNYGAKHRLQKPVEVGVNES